MITNGVDSTEITIRTMTKDDIVSYCSLFQNVFSKEPWNEKWTIKQIETIITRQFRKKGFVGMAAATTNGNVGYLTGFRLWLVPSVFYLDQLFVYTDYQGQKIGKKLLVETETYLKSLGVSRIFLFTKSKSYAETFYIKNDYIPFWQQIRIKGKPIYCKHI